MNKKVKKLWVEELRGGDFEQGKGALRVDKQCCCLGVLCELALEAGVKLKVEQVEGGYYHYDGTESVLPIAVMEWAGLTDDNPAVERNERGGLRSLSGLNDTGHDFIAIADLIEKSLVI